MFKNTQKNKTKRSKTRQHTHVVVLFRYRSSGPNRLKPTVDQADKLLEAQHVQVPHQVGLLERQPVKVRHKVVCPLVQVDPKGAPVSSPVR